MSGHHHEVEVEVGEDGVAATLQDDWLTKVELSKHRHAELSDIRSKMTKPMAKQEGERAQNHQFPVRERQSGAERVRECQSGADRVSEGATVAPAPSEGASDVPESAVEVQPVPVPSTVEGPTASIRLNPRQGRGQRNPLNVKSTSVKSHLATLDRVRELRAECK